MHANRIYDLIGQNWVLFQQSGHFSDSPSVPSAARRHGPLGELNGLVQQQVQVLTTIDSYIVFAGMVVFLMLVLSTLPVRTYPPRIALVQK